ncbi:rhomboid family intramembrane serine protease [Terribacillus saccharophilus]|uniref:rhomboid family intramembrane serine protease n=1 Tax=Terribacillus saccharophilus TaxID=361277 RepID=UPI003982302A
MFRRTESFKEYLYAYPVISLLVAVNLLLWIITGLLPTPFGNSLYQLGAGVNLFISLGDYWRLITPIFLHAPGSITHVLFNCFSLVVFGPALEQMLGKLKFTLFYLLAGIIGNIVTYVLDPYSFVSHIGASGAIYGLFGAYLFMIWFRKHLMDRGNAQVILVIFIVGIIMSLFSANINLAAHLGGAAAGFVLAPLFLIGAKPFSIYRNKRPRQGDEDAGYDPDRWKKRPYGRRTNKKLILWIVIAALVLIGIYDYMN